MIEESRPFNPAEWGPQFSGKELEAIRAAITRGWLLSGMNFDLDEGYDDFIAQATQIRIQEAIIHLIVEGMVDIGFNDNGDWMVRPSEQAKQERETEEIETLRDMWGDDPIEWPEK